MLGIILLLRLVYLRKEKSNSVTFNNVDIDLSLKLQEYKDLLDNYNFILNKINAKNVIFCNLISEYFKCVV